MTSVKLPESIIKIEDGAFAKNKFTEITIPNQVIEIGDSAFAWNPITSLIIPDSVVSIGEHAFGQCQLNSLVIGKSVTTIGERAFQTNRLTRIEIPNNVTKIEDMAFMDNEPLVEAIVSESVTFIGSSAFAFNYNMTNFVILGDNVSAEEGIFHLNNSLKSISIGNNIQFQRDDDPLLGDKQMEKAFYLCYDSNNKKAGVYTYNGKDWEYHN